MPDQPAASSPRIPAVWLVLGSIASVQVGAAFAKSLFAAAPPLAVSWLRIASAAVLLLVIARPWRRFPRRGEERAGRRWLLLLGFACCLCGMNVCIYLAFAHIPIGLAVTLEFLGPLGVAVVGSRQVADVLWAVLAAAGVALLGLAPGRLDPVGIGFALGAGALWAGYIVLGARMGDAWRGVDALALSCALGGLALTPVAWLSAGPVLARPHVLVVGVAVGLLSTVVPYSLELAALRRLPPATFGILMSLEPAAAAAAAFLVLHERLSVAQLVAMGCVIVASVGATRRARRTPAKPAA